MGHAAKKEVCPWLTIAHHHHLQVQLDHAVDRLSQQISSLLGHHPRDYPEQGNIKLRQAETPLQSTLAGQLTGQIICRVGGWQVPVSSRVPLIIINTVQDAVQVGGPLLQHPFQPPAIERGLDLTGIALADGIQKGGVVDTTFQQVDLIILFQPQKGEILPADIQHFHQAGIKITLMLHVMNGQD